MSRSLPFFLILLACSVVMPARATDASIDVKGWGVLVMPLPAGWRAVEKPGKTPAWTLVPVSGHAFEMQLSPIRSQDGYMPDTSKESLRKFVSLEASTVKAQSVEKDLPTREFQSGDVHGNWFTATDRAPKPGEFKYLASGLVAVKDLPVQFTILYDGNAKSSVEPALKMLGAAHKR